MPKITNPNKLTKGWTGARSFEGYAKAIPVIYQGPDWWCNDQIYSYPLPFVEVFDTEYEAIEHARKNIKGIKA